MLKVIVPVKKIISRQETAALAVILVFLGAVFFLRSSHAEAAVTASFGFYAGYVMQRSRFCFAGAFRDPFLIKNTALARAVLLALFVTTTGFTAVNFLSTSHLLTGGKIYPVGIHTVVGGVLFGFGMVIAGNCLSGCLVRLGEGYLMQWATLAGLIGGSIAGSGNLGWWNELSIARSPAVFLPGLTGWPLALLLQYALIGGLYCFALVLEHRPPNLRQHFVQALEQFKPAAWFRQRYWPYLVGAAALGLGNTLLFYQWGRPWGLSGGIAHFAGWLCGLIGLNPLKWPYFNNPYFYQTSQYLLNHPLVYLAAAMICGSLFACLRHREFRIRRPRSAKYMLSALCGGLLMGYSARIAMGCNIGGFLSGAGSFSLHGWVLGFAFLGGAYLGGKILVRSFT